MNKKNVANPTTRLAWAVACTALLAGGVSAQSSKAFYEDFESLPLGPNREEALPGLKVWTKTPPAGWVIDDSLFLGLGNAATDGVVEWAGWGFADRAWWASTAGDQTRTRFLKGQGTIAIADGDEWDDLPRTKPGTMNTWMITSPIDLSGIAANSVLVKFDSSWRPEAPQKAIIWAQYDNQAPVEVLRWTGDSADATYHPDAQNETVSILLANPEGGSRKDYDSAGGVFANSAWKHVVMTVDRTLEWAQDWLYRLVRPETRGTARLLGTRLRRGGFAPQRQCRPAHHRSVASRMGARPEDRGWSMGGSRVVHSAPGRLRGSPVRGGAEPAGAAGKSRSPN